MTNLDQNQPPPHPPVTRAEFDDLSRRVQKLEERPPAPPPPPPGDPALIDRLDALEEFVATLGGQYVTRREFRQLIETIAQLRRTAGDKPKPQEGY